MVAPTVVTSYQVAERHLVVTVGHWSLKDLRPEGCDDDAAFTIALHVAVPEGTKHVTVVSQDGRLHFPLGPHHKPTLQIPIYLPPRCAAETA